MSEQLAPAAPIVLSTADTVAWLRIEQRSQAMLEARMEARQAREQRRSLTTIAMLRLRALLSDVDIESAEGFCALVRLVWGAWLVLPLETFSSSATFASIRLIAPEWLWGLVVFASGAFSLAALLVGRRRLRLCAIFLGGISWGFLSGLFVWSNPESTASVIYPLLALLSIWAFLRLSVGRGGRWTA